jgi:hypothetical protein
MAEPKRPREQPETSTPKPPLHPYVVLAIAVVLPGVGQVVNGTPQRGLMMAFMMLSLGWVSWHLTTPDHSFLGRYAGGLFIYAIAALDAYKWARVRWELFNRPPSDSGGGVPAPSAGSR